MRGGGITEESRGGLSGAAQAALIAGCFGLLTAVLTNWDKMPWNRSAPPAPVATTSLTAAPPSATAATAGATAPSVADAAADVGAAEARALGAQADKIDEIADLIAGTPVSDTVGTPEPPIATGERRMDVPARNPDGPRTDRNGRELPGPRYVSDGFSGRWASVDDDNVQISVTGAPDGGGVRCGTMIDRDGMRVAVAVSGRAINFTVSDFGVPIRCSGELSSSGEAIHLTCTAGGEEQSMRLTRRP